MNVAKFGQCWPHSACFVGNKKCCWIYNGLPLGLTLIVYFVYETFLSMNWGSHFNQFSKNVVKFVDIFSSLRILTQNSNILELQWSCEIKSWKIVSFQKGTAWTMMERFIVQLFLFCKQCKIINLNLNFVSKETKRNCQGIQSFFFSLSLHPILD